MMKLRFCAVTVLSIIAPMALAQNNLSRDSADYWSKEYACRATVDNYNVTFWTENIDSTAKKIDAIMTKAGAPSQVHPDRYFYDPQMGYGQMVYTLSSLPADNAAKKLAGAGNIVNYSITRTPGGSDALKQIDERVSIIESELSMNADSLSKMPIATYFLRARLDALKRTRSVCALSDVSASFAIILQLDPRFVKKQQAKKTQ